MQKQYFLKCFTAGTMLLCGILFFLPVHAAEVKDPFESPDFVKTPKQLTADFAAIRKMKIEFTGTLPANTPAEVREAFKNPVSQKRAEDELRVLMMYRAVAGVPYTDVTLDRTQTAHATAAAMLLTKVGKLTHTPERPEGFSEDVYKFGYTGTTSSNIHWTSNAVGIPGTVRGYMNDSDAVNIAKLGHRRWCINPSMKSTGFGEHGNFSAMWSFDRSRDMATFDYDFIAFPARGLTPVDMLDAQWAWNVSLNAKKYKLTGDVQVVVTPSAFNPKTATFKKGTEPMEIDSLAVSQELFGIAPCVIFRPRGLTLTPGSAFCVEITGFSDMAGTPVTIRYWVVFTKPVP